MMFMMEVVGWRGMMGWWSVGKEYVCGYWEWVKELDGEPPTKGKADIDLEKEKVVLG
jgi:hypothetical protein